MNGSSPFGKCLCKRFCIDDAWIWILMTINFINTYSAYAYSRDTRTKRTIAWIYHHKWKFGISTNGKCWKNDRCKVGSRIIVNSEFSWMFIVVVSYTDFLSRIHKANRFRCHEKESHYVELYRSQLTIQSYHKSVNRLVYLKWDNSQRRWSLIHIGEWFFVVCLALSQSPYNLNETVVLNIKNAPF